MLKSPWELILTEPVPEVVELRSPDWAEKYFSAQSARSSSRVTLSPSYLLKIAAKSFRDGSQDICKDRESNLGPFADF